MAPVKGDYQSIMTHGWWVLGADSGSAPALTLSNDGDGDAVTATIAGDDDVTYTVYYRAYTDTAWTTGGTGVGDGDIAIAGLTNGTFYWFIAMVGGAASAPVLVYVTDHAVTHTYEIVAIVNPAERGREMEILACEIDT